MKQPLMFVLPLLVGVMAASVAMAQSTGVYKWTDSAGVVHYADHAPAAGNADRITLRGGAGVPGSAALPTPTPTPQAAGGDAKMATAEATARARNCDTARSNAQTLSSGAMLVDSNNPTTAKRLDGDELEAARRDAKRDVAAWCGGGAK